MAAECISGQRRVYRDAEMGLTQSILAYVGAWEWVRPVLTAGMGKFSFLSAHGFEGVPFLYLGSEIFKKMHDHVFSRNIGVLGYRKGPCSAVVGLGNLAFVASRWKRIEAAGESGVGDGRLWSSN